MSFSLNNIRAQITSSGLVKPSSTNSTSSTKDGALVDLNEAVPGDSVDFSGAGRAGAQSPVNFKGITQDVVNQISQKDPHVALDEGIKNPEVARALSFA